MSHSTYFVTLPLLKRNNCCLISHATYYHNKSPVVCYTIWLIRHPLIWSKVISLSSTASVLKNGKIHLKFYVQFYSEFTYYCICTFYRPWHQCSFPMKIDSESQAWSYPKLLYSFLSYLFKQHWMKQLNQTLLSLWLTTLALVT